MTEKSNKKVLYIVTKSVWGGAGKYTYDLATGLPTDKFEIFVAAGGQGELAQKIKKSGITYCEIKNFTRDVSAFKDIFSCLETLKLLLKIRPDIIHVSSSKAGGIVGISALLYRLSSFRRPLKIFTAHGWAFAEPRPSMQVKLIKIFSKLTCLFYDKIICVSEFDKQLAINDKITSSKKLITIHNGIKFDEYQFLPKDKARKEIIRHLNNLPEDKTNQIWLVTIGEFTKNKGHKYLIDAVKKLITNDYSLTTVIMGWGEEKEKLEAQIVKLNLKDTVFLIGNESEPAKYLKAFDIFVLPSLKEGLPYVLLEAGLARLPVVASETGGIPEIIGQDGLLSKPASAKSLAEKIEHFLTNTKLAIDMPFELWGKINRKFRFEQMLKATLDVYNSTQPRRLKKTPIPAKTATAKAAKK